MFTRGVIASGKDLTYHNGHQLRFVGYTIHNYIRSFMYKISTAGVLILKGGRERRRRICQCVKV